MSGIIVAQLVSTSAYAGFQWTVHLVVYPQLGEVPPVSFSGYERAHQRRISRVVGPLFAALALTTGGLMVVRPAGVPGWGIIASAVLLAVILGVTGLLAVPLHRRLDDGWDPGAHRRLTRVDAVRVGAATANLAVAIVLASQ